MLMWQHIKDFVPLAQTALWVGLIVWFIKKYGSFIDQILELFRKRVESGSSVKAGPFEIGELIEPQSLSNQKREADEEILEFSESSVQYEAHSRSELASIRSDYFLTEDLALRMIQDEYGESITRNVKVFPQFEADGIFTKDGILHVVEVRAVTVDRFKKIATRTLSRLDNVIRNQTEKNIVIVFVVVIRDSKNKGVNIKPIEIPVNEYYTKIKTRTYQEAELKAAFGIV